MYIYIYICNVMQFIQCILQSYLSNVFLEAPLSEHLCHVGAMSHAI